MNASAASPQLHAPGSAPVLHRKCACEGSGSECSECKAEKEGKLQPKAASSVIPTEAPPIVHQVLRSPGQPMDRGLRSQMESGFGHDFSQVRIHTGNQAAHSASAVGASAYTVGNHVVFGANRYEPSSNDGRRLIAHELTHVVQQGGDAKLVQRQHPPKSDDKTDVPLTQDKSDPRNSPRYIDNLFTSVSPANLVTGITTFYLKEGGKEKKVRIPFKDLNQDKPSTSFADLTVYKSKAEALAAVERTKKEYGSLAAAYYTYYTTEDGVIMPTSFFEASTPKFYALWPDLIRLQSEDRKEISRGLRELANSINPYPCTQVDENGDLTASINLTNCALPILLHGYSIHQATRGSRVPGVDSESPATRKSVPPENDAPPAKKSVDTAGHDETKPPVHDETKPPAAKDAKQPENKTTKDTEMEPAASKGAADFDEDIPEPEPAADPNEKDVNPAICFPAGTLVSTTTGLVPIETLHSGDLVYAFDELSRSVVTQKIHVVIYGSTSSWVKIGTGVEDFWATQAHPFWIESEQRWVPAKDLVPGMLLLRQNGESLPVTSVEVQLLAQDEKTYNLSVENSETFFIGQSGVLVHNIKASRLKYLSRPGYRNYVLRAGGPKGTIYYSGMYGPEVTASQVQYRHRNNHNRFNPENGDYFELKPGTREYGEARIIEHETAVNNHTIIGRKGDDYRGNRQDPLAESKRAEYYEYREVKRGCK